MGTLFGRRKLLVIAPAALVAIAVTGCATQFTGGGWIQSALGGSSANFGLTYKVTDASTGAGMLSGSYTDRDASGNPVVKLDFQDSPTQTCFGSGVSCDQLIAEYCDYDSSCIEELTALAEQAGFNRCMDAEFNYRSRNKSNAGTGTGELIACDNTDKMDKQPQPNSGDYLNIRIDSGPYDGYSNEGNLQGGNLKAASTKK